MCCFSVSFIIVISIAIVFPYNPDDNIGKQAPEPKQMEGGHEKVRQEQTRKQGQLGQRAQK